MSKGNRSWLERARIGHTRDHLKIKLNTDI